MSLSLKGETMKLSASLSLAFAILFLAASTLSAAPQPVSAVAGLQLATPAVAAPSCGTSALAFLPAPLASDTPVACGGCSSPFCKGRSVGSFCGPTTIGRCVVGPACTTGGVTCLCQ
jgi:hypothetical protein